MCPESFARNWNPFLRSHLLQIGLKFLPPTDAQEACDETLLCLLKALPRLPEDGDGFSIRVYARWLHRKMMIRVWHKSKKRITTAPLTIPGDRGGTAENPALLEGAIIAYREEVLRRDMVAEANALLAQLSESDRELLVALHVQGFVLREMAAKMGCSYQTVSNRARKAIRQIIASQGTQEAV